MAIVQAAVTASSSEVLAADADDDRQVTVAVVSGQNQVFIDTATATATGGFPVGLTPVTLIVKATEVLHAICPNGGARLAIIDSVIATPA